MANIINSKAYHLLRRDTLKNWQEKNPLLKSGEICLVTDAENSSKMIKICTEDNTPWSELEYFSPTQIDISGIDVSGKMDKFGTVKKNGNNGQTVQLDTLTYLNDSNGQIVAMIGISTDELNLNKNLGMMNKKITNLGNPTTDTDAVNKNYVDTAIGNIDSALGEIITIQNSILGGGA